METNDTEFRAIMLLETFKGKLLLDLTWLVNLPMDACSQQLSQNLKKCLMD